MGILSTVCFALLVVMFYMKLDDINDGINDIRKKMGEIKDKV